MTQNMRAFESIVVRENVGYPYKNKDFIALHFFHCMRNAFIFVKSELLSFCRVMVNSFGKKNKHTCFNNVDLLALILIRSILNIYL